MPQTCDSISRPNGPLNLSTSVNRWEEAHKARLSPVCPFSSGSVLREAWASDSAGQGTAATAGKSKREGHALDEVPKKEGADHSSALRRFSPAVAILSLGLNFWLLQRYVGARMAASLLAIMAVHELGHFMVARWFKVPALWPVFVPWLGACVVMLSKAKSAHDQAWIALGGPVCGIALTCLFHWLAFCVDSELLLDAAIWGYLVHLINLIPAGGLDGGHVAGFIGRWLWVPGAAGLILATFLIGDLSWYSRLLLGFLAFTAVCRAWAFVAEKTTAREPFVEEPISSSRKKVVWLVFLSLAYVCAGGAILAQLQLEAQMIHRLEHGGRGLDKPDAEDARTEESSDREYDIMNGTERFF